MAKVGASGSAGGVTGDSRAALVGQLDRTAGAALGKDFVKEVLPALGPDWGLCVTAPPPQEKGWFPQAVLALRAAPGDETAPVDQALVSALHSWAVLAVLGHNRQHPDRREEELCDLLIRRGEAERQAGELGFRQTLLEAAELAQRLGDDRKLVRAALANTRGMQSETGIVDEARPDACLRLRGRLRPPPGRVRPVPGHCSGRRRDDHDGGHG